VSRKKKNQLNYLKSGDKVEWREAWHTDNKGNREKELSETARLILVDEMPLTGQVRGAQGRSTRSRENSTTKEENEGK